VEPPSKDISILAGLFNPDPNVATLIFNSAVAKAERS